MSKKIDREKLFDEAIQPLVDQIYDLCHEHDFYYLAFFQIEKVEDGMKMGGSCYLPEDAYPRLHMAHMVLQGECQALNGNDLTRLFSFLNQQVKMVD